jgi:hypothetical protein
MSVLGDPPETKFEKLIQAMLTFCLGSLFGLLPAAIAVWLMSGVEAESGGKMLWWLPLMLIAIWGFIAVIVGFFFRKHLLSFLIMLTLSSIVIIGPRRGTMSRQSVTRQLMNWLAPLQHAK